jgi:excisionase family DNA binding protein
MPATDKPTPKPQVREPEYIPRKDAAFMISVSVQSIDKRIRDGSLPARRLGRKILVRRSDVLALLEAVNQCD